MLVEHADLRLGQILLRVPGISSVFTLITNQYFLNFQIKNLVGNPDQFDQREIDLMWYLINYNQGIDVITKTISYIDERWRFQHISRRWIGI
jgi:hypothetical protein